MGKGRQIRGMALVPGVAYGEAFVVKVHGAAGPERLTAAVDIDYELQKLQNAADQVATELRFIKEQVARNAGEEVGRLFDVQSLLVGDRHLLDDLEERIRHQGLRLDCAIEDILVTYDAEFRKADTPYLREKLLDIKDVLTRVQRHSLIRDTQEALKTVQHRILVADEILPSVVLTPDGKPFDGIVTVVGGLGSHATILTKSYGIPVMGIAKNAIRRIRNGDLVLVDSQASVVHVNPRADLVADVQTRRAAYAAYRQRIGRTAREPARTTDREQIGVFANCGTLDDVRDADEYGCDGVGLLRTEFLFYGHHTFPTEDEQFRTYRDAVAASGPRPVVIRTLDLVGDKSLPHFLVPKQLNPYLGWRSLKISLDHPTEFKTQIKAILRAGHHGNVRILFPMVTTYWDAHRCREYVAECRDELGAAGVEFASDMPCGAMIEAPAAVTCLEDIAAEFDFIAIGSNDLTQHLLAVDRDNPRVSEFYVPHHPAVCTVIKEIVTRCSRLGRPVTLCGEMAGNPYYLALLVGLGLRALSVAPMLVPICKDIVRHVGVEDATSMAQQALRLKMADDTMELLRSYLHARYPDIAQLVRP